MVDKQRYAKGTYLLCEYPFGLYRGGRAICPDGKARNLKRISVTADTFFSVPASVTVNGKTVSGYVTLDKTGLDGTVAFIPYAYGKNGDIFS